MSRIGKKEIQIPNGVEVKIDGSAVTVKGPKGELSCTVSERVKVAQEESVLKVSRIDNEKYSRGDHGLYRSLVANMVTGVTEGFTKKLELNGVGFKVAMSGKGLKMSLGFSHDVNYNPPEGIDISVDGNVISVSGIDKQLVGQTAADIRALKKPEPYKGKGIKYQDEYIIRKSGKAAGGS